MQKEVAELQEYKKKQTFANLREAFRKSMTTKGIAERKQKIKDDDSFERGLAEDKDNAMSELKIELKTSKDTMAKLEEKIGEV